MWRLRRRRERSFECERERVERDAGSGELLKPLSLFLLTYFILLTMVYASSPNLYPPGSVVVVVVYLPFAASSSTMESLIPLPFGREIIGLLPVPMAKTLVARVANSWPAASLR